MATGLRLGYGFLILADCWPPAGQATVHHAHGMAISTIFYVSTGMLGLCLLLCTVIKDVRMLKKTRDASTEASEMQNTKNGGVSRGDSVECDNTV